MGELLLINFFWIENFFFDDFYVAVNFSKKTTGVAFMTGGFADLFDFQQNRIVITIDNGNTKLSNRNPISR